MSEGKRIQAPDLHRRQTPKPIQKQHMKEAVAVWKASAVAATDAELRADKFYASLQQGRQFRLFTAWASYIAALNMELPGSLTSSCRSVKVRLLSLGVSVPISSAYKGQPESKGTAMSHCSSSKFFTDQICAVIEVLLNNSPQPQQAHYDALNGAWHLLQKE